MDPVSHKNKCFICLEKVVGFPINMTTDFADIRGVKTYRTNIQFTDDPASEFRICEKCVDVLESTAAQSNEDEPITAANVLRIKDRDLYTNQELSDRLYLHDMEVYIDPEQPDRCVPDITIVALKMEIGTTNPEP